MSSLIRGVGRAELNRNVFRSQEDILSRSKVFFCPSTWPESVDQNALSEMVMAMISWRLTVTMIGRLTKCMKILGKKVYNRRLDY